MRKSISIILDYESLVCSYEDRLLNQLRSHGVDQEFLELWVPDEDPVASIVSMIEAAGAFGEKELFVRINHSTLANDRTKTLKPALDKLGTVSIESDAESITIYVSELGI